MSVNRGIEKSIPRITVGSHEACLVIQMVIPRDEKDTKVQKDQNLNLILACSYAGTKPYA